MTRNESKVLSAVRALTRASEVRPTIRLIAETAGVGLSKTHESIVSLEARGRIVRTEDRNYKVMGNAPPRDEIERWSDEEVRRVSLALHEISRERGLDRVMVSA